MIEMNTRVVIAPTVDEYGNVWLNVSAVDSTGQVIPGWTHNPFASVPAAMEYASDTLGVRKQWFDWTLR